MTELCTLLGRIRACTLCADCLPLGPRPVVQAGRRAKLLIIGQAPGRRVHESGIPFDDASGQRLRDWLPLERDTFYDPQQVAIMPMGFCYPGTGTRGDLPPSPRCAPQWHQQLLQSLPGIGLCLLVGQYAQKYYLPDSPHATLAARVRNWQQLPPGVLALPHPSPRNNLWLRNNPWFEQQLLPQLQAQVRQMLG